MSDREVNEEGVRAVVRDFILSECLPGEDASALKDDTPLVTGGVLDSISTARLVSFLEARYEIRFKPHEVGADRLDTVDKIVQIIQEKRKVKGG